MGVTLALSEYHVAIICALAIELAAMRAMLDEEHGLINEKDVNDHNVYFAGKIHEHNVVIACLPAGVDGVAAAATIAKDISRTFQQLRFGLLVGIAGGIPDIDGGIDIRLGDVVVSQPNGICTGVVQYDKGKRKRDAGFGWERKGSLNAPPVLLLTALQALKADHECSESKVIDYLSQLIETHPKMANTGYAYPGLEHDVLYHGGKPVSRAARSNAAPQLHYGTVASGNAVIKDSAVRDHIRLDCGALCVEMEAAGLMNDFPCMVIRGISDYADEHKNDKWHRYAATTAAAFAKELLLYISRKQANEERLVGQILDTINRQSKEVMDIVQIQKEQALLRKCHQALYTSPYADHKDINKKAVPGTCQWLLQHPKFRGWYGDDAASLLWVSADPGCGKSVLSKYLVDEFLRTDAQTAPHTVCYFFFKDNDGQDGLATALSAILHQIFDQQPNLIRYAIPSWQTYGPGLTSEAFRLWRILQSAIKDPDVRPVVCVIDGLDECRDKDRKQLITFLCDHYQECEADTISEISSIKFLVTSRPYEDIQSAFGQLPPHLPTIRLRGEDENDQIHSEINLVLKAYMPELTQELQLSPQNARRIEDSLYAAHNRTYLWLHLVVDHIRYSFPRSLRPDDEQLILLPHTVEEAYEKLLSRVSKHSNEGNVRIILSIVIAARYALTVQEMTLALDIATASNVDSLTDFVLNSERVKQNIRQWCGLFVFINHDRIYLLHQTAKEFLMNHEFQQSAKSWYWRGTFRHVELEALMAKVCVDFLSLKEFDQDVLGKLMGEFVSRPVFYPKLFAASSDDVYVLNLLLKRCGVSWQAVFAFFRYAAEHWPLHFRNAQSQVGSEVVQTALALYDSSTLRFRRSRLFASSSTIEGVNANSFAILWAARNGHSQIVDRLLCQSREYIDYHDVVTGKTALIIASEQGHSDVVRVLLSHGARLDAMYKEGETALSLAVRGNHSQVVKLLLDARPRSTVGFGKMFLRALFRNQDSVLELLFENGLDVNMPLEPWKPLDDWLDFGLNDYSIGDKSRLIQLSREQYLSDNSTGWGTALHLLVWKRDVKLLRRIINYGGNVNAHCERTGSVLETSCITYSKAIFDLLWNHGAGVDPATNVLADISAFHAAVASCHLDVIQLFLSKGVNVEVENSDGLNAIQIACVSGTEDVIQLLLSSGARVNAVSEYHGTALQLACKRGDTRIVCLLLREGAEVNMKTGKYGTAIQVASTHGHYEVVQTMLTYGAKMDHDGGKYGSAIHAAAAQGHIRIMELLIESGANPDARCPPLGSVLQAAVLEGHKHIAERLLELNVDPIGTGGPFDCSLCAARVNDHHDIEKLLIKHGAICTYRFDRDETESSTSSGGSSQISSPGDLYLDTYRPILHQQSPQMNDHPEGLWYYEVWIDWEDDDDEYIAWLEHVAEDDASQNSNAPLSPTQYYDPTDAYIACLEETNFFGPGQTPAPESISNVSDYDDGWMEDAAQATDPEDEVEALSPSNMYDPVPLDLSDSLPG